MNSTNLQPPTSDLLPPPPAALPKALPTGNTRLKLEACERRIKASLNTVTLMSVKVGEELDLIRSERLYREEFDTFEAYCLSQWSWTASRARQHIAAARIARSLGLPNGALPIGMTNERQLRALNVLPPAHRLEAWTEAINAWTATAPRGRDVSVRHVEQTVRRMAAGLGIPIPSGSQPQTPLPEVEEVLPTGNPFEPSVVPLRPKETREARLKTRMDRIIAEVREAIEECGTPDSEAAAKLLRMLADAQDVRAHEEQLENLQSSRS